MHVPPITDPCWERLAEDAPGDFYTGHLPTRMLMDRLRRSDAAVPKKAAELFAYFARWSDSLPAEVAQIRQL